MLRDAWKARTITISFAQCLTSAHRVNQEYQRVNVIMTASCDIRFIFGSGFSCSGTDRSLCVGAEDLLAPERILIRGTTKMLLRIGHDEREASTGATATRAVATSCQCRVPHAICTNGGISPSRLNNELVLVLNSY